MPPAVRAAWVEELPRSGNDAAGVYADYRPLIGPYGPRFFGWVHGGGTVVRMLAEMLASGLNANCGGGDHAPVDCEREGAAGVLGLPAESSRLVVTVTSMSNFAA
jgi:aromatic-L-amino-acid/L-tryptophan decarboxylase